MADGDDRPRVLVDDRQDLPLDAASLAALARSTLVAEGATEVELSLSFVPEDEIAALRAEIVALRQVADRVVARPLDLVGHVDPGVDLRVLVALVALDVKKGDKVLFGKWSGTEVKLDGEELLIMKESDIMGVVEGRKAKK